MKSQPVYAKDENVEDRIKYNYNYSRQEVLEIILTILRVLFFAILVIVGASVALHEYSKNPVPIPLGTNTLYYGYISDGKKFGLQIGASRSSARVLFEDKGFSYSGGHSCLRKLKTLINCTQDQKYDLYRVREPFRDGLAYLEFKNDKVTAIIWNFSDTGNLDF